MFCTEIINIHYRKLIFEWISHLYGHCVESGTKVQRKLMTWLLVESSGCYKSSTNQTTLVFQIIRYCLQGAISLLILPLLDHKFFAVHFLVWPVKSLLKNLI